MEALFGIKGKDFVIVAADKHAQFSICQLKNDCDKIMVIDDNKLYAGIGPNADVTNFLEYTQKNVHLYRHKNNVQLGCRAAANWTRNALAHMLRRNPHQVDMIIAGYDDEGPQLYFLDYLSSLNSLNKAAHGYGAYFALSIMDRYWKPDITEAEGLEVIRKCIQEMKTRFIINMDRFTIKIVDKDGVRTLQQPPVVEAA